MFWIIEYSGCASDDTYSNFIKFILCLCMYLDLLAVVSLASKPAGLQDYAVV